MDEPRVPEESELVERARTGDDDALCLLLDRYDEVVRRRVSRLLPAEVRRRVSIADVLQDTRLVAFEKRAAFAWRGEGSYRAWLLGIAENKVRHAIRTHVGAAARSLRREVTRTGRPDTRERAGRERTPSGEAILSETVRLAREAIDMVPPAQREVLRLCREEGLTLRECAVRTGRTYEATKKLFGRGLARFTAAFEGLQKGKHE